MARVQNRVGKLVLQMEQRGELCRVTMTGGQLRYGGPESKYHLLVNQMPLVQVERELNIDDAILQWTFKGFPKEFGLEFPGGHSADGRYQAILIDNFTGNDALGASNLVTIRPEVPN